MMGGGIFDVPGEPGRRRRRWRIRATTRVVVRKPRPAEALAQGYSAEASLPRARLRVARHRRRRALAGQRRRPRGRPHPVVRDGRLVQRLLRPAHAAARHGQRPRHGTAPGYLGPSSPRCRPSCMGAGEVSVLDMASAFSTFRDHGQHYEPVIIERVEDSDGNVLFQADHQPEPVISAQIADTVTTALRGVVTNGTGTGHRRSVVRQDGYGPEQQGRLVRGLYVRRQHRRVDGPRGGARPGGPCHDQRARSHGAGRDVPAEMARLHGTNSAVAKTRLPGGGGLRLPGCRRRRLAALELVLVEQHARPTSPTSVDLDRSGGTTFGGGHPLAAADFPPTSPPSTVVPPGPGGDPGVSRPPDGGSGCGTRSTTAPCHRPRRPCPAGPRSRA